VPAVPLSEHASPAEVKVGNAGMARAYGGGDSVSVATGLRVSIMSM
jgi:hypothetical protein